MPTPPPTRTIAAVDVFPTLLPLAKTFTFASGSTGAAGERAPHVFVRVTDSQGETGWGEARPVPAWSYETLETVTTTLRRYLGPAVVGLPVHDRVGLQRAMFRTIGRGPSPGQPIAKCALDMAVHDLCARAAYSAPALRPHSERHPEASLSHTGLPLRAFLGGSPAPHTVALSYTVTPHTPEEAAADVTSGLAEGYRHFNFKAGLGKGPNGVHEDIALAEAIHRAAGPDSFLWADANQGYQLHQARLAAEGFRAAGVNVLEQPLPADQLPLMRQLRASTALPLAVDESSVGPADFLSYVREGLVDYLVIKLARSAGVWPTMEQLAIASAAGLPFLVSGLTETLLAKTAACQVASVYGFAGPAALNGSQFIDPTAELALFPHKPEIERAGAVHLPQTPGIGVTPDLAALKEYAADV